MLVAARAGADGRAELQRASPSDSALVEPCKLLVVVTIETGTVMATVTMTAAIAVCNAVLPFTKGPPDTCGAACVSGNHCVARSLRGHLKQSAVGFCVPECATCCERASSDWRCCSRAEAPP